MDGSHLLNVQAISAALDQDLENALAAGLEQGKDVVVGPLESEMVDGTLTFRVRRHLISAHEPTPAGYRRYCTSEGLPDQTETN